MLDLGADPGAVEFLTGGAARARVPLEVLSLHHDGLRDLMEASLVLVRPDRHVAWRGEPPPADSSLWDTVRGEAAVPIAEP